MKVAIMQPYLFPYIGYWQLIQAVDKFVIYDNIQYEKNGWMRRNRILTNGIDKLFTIPIEKGSDYADVWERRVASDSLKEVTKILRMIEVNYKKTPYYEDVYPLIENCLTFDSENLFDYICHSVRCVCEYLNIKTEIIVSSSLNIDRELKKEKRVLATCKALDATTYINPSGGMELYSKEMFEQEGIELYFLRSKLTPYKQGQEEFIPALSIIDLMMRLSKEELQKQLEDFILL